MRFRTTVLGALLVLLLSANLPGVAAGVQAPDECSGADEYATAVRSIGDQLDEGLEDLGLSLDDIETWASSDFDHAARLFDEMASELKALTPPPAATQAHQDAIKLYGMVSQMLTSMQAAGLFGALPYAESIEQTSSDLRESALDFELACNVAFLDHDDDGSSEIGLGSVATPVAGADTGSRQDPIEIGTTVDVSEDWQVTVLSVEPDATARVLRENQFNDRPEVGRQFFIAEVAVTYNGEDSDSFSHSDLAAVGQLSTAYSTYEDSCGVIPNQLSTREMFSGGTITGNVCWSIEAEDVDSLVMYYRDATEDDRVFLSLSSS